MPKKGYRFSSESKLKMRLAHLGEKQSKERINKRFLWQKDYKHSDVTRKKIGLANSIALKGRLPKNRYNQKGSKLPEEHKKKISIAMRKRVINGIHNFWKGGITSINAKIRSSLEYELWRKSIFVRDHFICQKYGIKGGELIAHHIQNFADFPELRIAIDNGITLSKKAHIEFHKRYGKKNNTREQLEEFIDLNEKK